MSRQGDDQERLKEIITRAIPHERPTEKDIAELPRWARVAFAARCARRALHLFQKHWPDAQPGHIRDVIQAVTVAEHSAAAAADAGAALAALAAATIAAAAAPHSMAAAGAANAAAGAADAAAATYAAKAAAEAANAVINAGTAGVAIPSIRADLNTIRNLAVQKGWDDCTPVPPEVFGPLEDPAPTPVVPPSATPADFQLVLKVYLSPDANPQEVGDKLVRLYGALNDYSIAQYGKGLTVKEFEQFVRTGVLEPAGGR